MITVCKSISMFAAKLPATGVDRPGAPSHGAGRLLMVVALAAMLAPLWGCGDGEGGTGAGTVDISQAKNAAKDAAASNPEIAKAAAARNRGTLGDTQKGGKNKSK